MELEFVAGHARLTDLEHRRSPLKAISNRDRCLVGALKREIFSEAAWSTKKIVLLLPPWPVIRRIGVHRFVRTPMMFEIGLRVARKIRLADLDRRARDGLFLDGGDKRFAAIEPDEKWPRDIDGKNAEFEPRDVHDTPRSFAVRSMQRL